MDIDADIPRNTNHPNSSPSSPAQTTPKKQLLITSFSHRRGPLRPPPTKGLSFDIRALPNPPKRIRDAYTGVSKVLREAFMGDEETRRKVGGIVSAIRAHLVAVDALAEEAVREREAAAVRNKGRGRGRGGSGSGGRRASVVEKEEGEEEEEEEGEGEGEEEEDEDDVEVRVGVCCEVGRHRSVACVEELARIRWPDGWVVEVEHRDLDARRSEKDKEKRPRRGARGGAEEEDD